MWSFVNRLSALKYFYGIAKRWQGLFGGLFLVFFFTGLFFGLLLAPADYQQGNAYRIMFIHVPAAVMSLLIYGIMAMAVFVFLVWKIKLADLVAKVSLPLGAIFTALTLVTGSLWGKPTWGTFWIWDARLTSELLLLFIYLGIFALRRAVPDEILGAKAAAMLTLVGLVNLPIVHYSVQWWHTLHQGATLLKFAAPSIAPSMLCPLLLMLAAYVFFYGYIVLVRLRTEILQREQQARWVQQLQAEF